MTKIQTFRPSDGLPPEIGAAIYALANAIWLPEPGAKTPTLQETLTQWKAQQSAHFVIGEGAKIVVAHALIFRRDVHTPQGPLGVGALATVCVHPDYRGRNWGADVVRAAFDYLPELGVSVSLFQTGVPAFYEKLGGRRVTNAFHNGASLDNPFWDACEMIFPADYPWPGGPIDLNGPGY